MLHVSVADVDAWYKFVTNQFEQQTFSGQSRVMGKPKDEGYGRVFYVLDPSGVLLHIAQFS